MSKYLLLWCCNVLLHTFCKWLVGKKLIIRSTSIFFVQQLTVMHMCKRKKIVCFSFGLNVFVHPLTKFFLFYEIKCTRLKKSHDHPVILLYFIIGGQRVILNLIKPIKYNYISNKRWRWNQKLWGKSQILGHKCFEHSAITLLLLKQLL